MSQSSNREPKELSVLRAIGLTQNEIPIYALAIGKINGTK